MVDLCFKTDAERCANASGEKLGVSNVSSACRFTTSLFLFSFIYCFVRGFVQSLLFSLDLEYSTLTDGIVDGGQIAPENTTFLEGPLGHLHLQMCNDVPHGQSPFGLLIPASPSSTRLLIRTPSGIRHPNTGSDVLTKPQCENSRKQRKRKCSREEKTKGLVDLFSIPSRMGCRFC